MIKAYFLGTNGWYDTKTGSTICTLLEYDKFNIILDAGNGFSKLDQCIDLDKPVYLFISHLHLDHISGLHTVPKYIFKKGLNILLHEKIVKAFKTFQDFPYTAPVGMIKKFLKYDVNIMELPKQIKELPFKLTILPVVHSVDTIAARIEAEGKVVTYVMDTGICGNAIKLAKNANLLITECSHKPGEENKDWPHLSPEEAAEVAVKSSCRKLILTHFDANRYKTMSLRKKAESIAQKIFKKTTAGFDGLIYEL